MFNILRANWDRTQTILCHVNNLANELKKARLYDGKLIYVSTGSHAFAIEKIKEGFYVFEPNYIRKQKKQTLLKTEQEVANEIIKNQNFFINPSNNNIGLSLNFISYGDENREIDDIIIHFEKLVEQSNSYENAEINYLKPATMLIKNYKEKNLSREELALMLYIELNEIEKIDKAFVSINDELINYLQNNEIFANQLLMDENLTDETFIHGKAYADDISCLYLAIAMSQISLAKKLIKKGANPNVARKDSVTPLYIAAQNGDIGCLKLLLENNANPDLPTRHGATCFIAFLATK